MTKKESDAIKAVVHAWMLYDKVCSTIADEGKRRLDLKYKHGLKERKLWDDEADIEEANKLDQQLDELDEVKAKRFAAFRAAEAKAVKICGDWVADMF